MRLKKWFSSLTPTMLACKYLTLITVSYCWWVVVEVVVVAVVVLFEVAQTTLLKLNWCLGHARRNARISLEFPKLHLCFISPTLSFLQPIYGYSPTYVYTMHCFCIIYVWGYIDIDARGVIMYIYIYILMTWSLSQWHEISRDDVESSFLFLIVLVLFLHIFFNLSFFHP